VRNLNNSLGATLALVIAACGPGNDSTTGGGGATSGSTTAVVSATGGGTTNGSAGTTGSSAAGGGATGQKCGNGVVDPGEECDDGNTANEDGCNVNCHVEPSSAVPGGDPMGTAPGDLGAPVQFSVCNNEAETQQYTPGPWVVVRACALRYLDGSNHGVDDAAVQQEFVRAQTFFNFAGVNITLKLLFVDTFSGQGTDTDPNGNMELATLHSATRQRVDALHPNQCDVVVGYVNTIHDDNGLLGGQATWPEQGLAECLVAHSNVGNGESTAHELGHVFGLFHTFEPAGDGCQDTPDDPNCSVGGGCSVSCAPVSIVFNVMSYYLCGTPQAEALSSCQARRARCFVAHMFDLDACADSNYCNGHGSCSDGNCSCNVGFAGAHCESCAPDYIGYPSCTHNCPANFCNGHGVCSNNKCTCAAGYTEPLCDSCLPSYGGYPNCVEKACTFYTGPNYSGASDYITSGSSYLDLGPFGWGNDFSSSQCFGGASAQLWVNTNFSGASWMVSGSVPDYGAAAYGNLNNNASSLKVY
jgi:cysteine-rich repeat protein